MMVWVEIVMKASSPPQQLMLAVSETAAGVFLEHLHMIIFMHNVGS